MSSEPSATGWSPRRSATAVYLMFVLSGVAGLIFQVLWARRLALVFGNTLESVTTTVCAFLLGLALGAWLAGRWLVGRPNGLRVFACLEIGVAVSGLAVTYAIPWVTPVAQMLARSSGGEEAGLSLARLLLVMALLLVPCIAMGGTLPVLTQGLIARGNGGFSGVLASLYAANTLGAALGALATSFLLIPWLGVLATAAVAAGLDALVALAALGLAGSEPGESPARAAVGPPRARWEAWLALVGSGFCGLALEIAWTRLLVFFNGSDVYAFSTVLATYLLGLVLGSSLLGRGRSLRRARLLLPCLFLFLGAAAFSAFWMLPWISALHGDLLGQISMPWVRLCISALLILPGTVVLGALFPLSSQLIDSSRGGNHGTSVGEAYLWNTVGSVSGCLLAGFVLLPRLGLQGTFAAVAVTAVGVGLLLALTAPRPMALRVAGGVVGLFLAGAILSTPSDALRRNFYEPRGTVLFQGEDQHGAVALLREFEAYRGVDSVNLIVDGFTMAGGSLHARRYTTMLAQVPIQMHPDPKRVLVVCLGLGNTLRAAVASDRTARVDCVELSRKVLEAVRFIPDLGPTLSSPKLTMHVNDGRNFLLTTENRYDVITAEPPPPTHAGIVNLYSKEYYELCRSRLKPGGLVAHWLPVNQMSVFDAKTIIRAFLEVFPHATLWEGQGLNLCLLGSERPLQVTWPELSANIHGDAEVLGPVGLDRPELFAATYLKGPEALRRYVAGTPPVTDDRPFIEYPSGPWGFDARFFFVGRESLPLVEAASARARLAKARTFQSWRLTWRFGGAGGPQLSRLIRANLARLMLSSYPTEKHYRTEVGANWARYQYLRTTRPLNALALAEWAYMRGRDAEAARWLARLDPRSESSLFAHGLRLLLLEGQAPADAAAGYRQALSEEGLSSVYKSYCKDRLRKLEQASLLSDGSSG